MTEEQNLLIKLHTKEAMKNVMWCEKLYFCFANKNSMIKNHVEGLGAKNRCHEIGKGMQYFNYIFLYTFCWLMLVVSTCRAVH